MQPVVVLVRFWRGFHQQQLNLDEMWRMCAKATIESGKQPRSLSNVRFTLERATAHYQRQIQGKNRTPTTVLLLTGSPMQKREAKLVIDQQRNSDMDVEGGDFFIEIGALTQAMDDVGKQSFRELDDAFRGTQDINDVTEMEDDKLLRMGPSAELLFKMLNAHNPTVDKMNLKKAGHMYGRTELLGPGQTKLEMPSFEDAARALGQWIEKEEVEGNGALNNGAGGPEGQAQYKQVQVQAVVVDREPFGNKRAAAV